MRDKHARLLDLAHRRQRTRWPPHKCIADYHQGQYECDFVSPYTKSASNVDAKVMVLLQDWSCDETLSGELLPEGVTVGHDPHRQTNRRLRALLRQHFDLEFEHVYATNVFPFVKLGGMSAPIPRRDLVRAAQAYALPQIAIVEPRLAVCLGKAAFDAVAAATGRRPDRSLEDAIARPFEVGRTQVWCQAHTGRLGTNNRNRGGVDRVTQDWGRMARAYHWQPVSHDPPHLSRCMPAGPAS